jgi:hypothetical protein
VIKFNISFMMLSCFLLEILLLGAYMLMFCAINENNKKQTVQKQR